MIEKLNKMKTIFTIKDLENLSGVKMHTIRIWEQRYGLLVPVRTSSNIRTYSTQDMKRLLNVVHLYKAGYKISKIAKLNDSEISREIQAVSNANTKESTYIDKLERASLELNESSFVTVFDEMEERYSFTDVFERVVFPFLNKVGELWLIGKFNAINEHFVSNMLKQRLFSAINKLPLPEENSSLQFVLFLPPNELHELSLLYMHFLLRRNQHDCVYLGQSVPLEDLVLFTEKQKKIIFIGYSTVYPEEEKFNKYMNDLQDLAMGKNEMLFVTDRKIELTKKDNKKMSVFKTKKELVSYIHKMENEG